MRDEDLFDLEVVLEEGPPAADAGARIGSSREGRPIVGYEFDSSAPGALPVSLIAGCHADEPVGPALLDRVATHLGRLRRDEPEHPLLRNFRWRLVPHVNPDGEARNETWTASLGEPHLWGRDGHRRFDLPSYLQYVVREAPGDDVEFGFPRDLSRDEADDQADEEAGDDPRPENQAVAGFLRAGAEAHGPYALHASFHGMAFAAGPWFLLERRWISRTAGLRDELRRQEGDWTFHDIDRGGEKGFERIDRGFTTRPDSEAMRRHFLDRGDEDTAALFRPSSMEYVRSLGGDPLTLVSEMPLFVVPASQYQGDDADLLRPPAVRELRDLAARTDLRDRVAAESVRAAARRLGVLPMPVDEQMRWQLRFLNAALRCVAAHGGGDPAGAVSTP